MSAVAPAVIGEARASEALAIVAGSGTLPFAVADAALGAGRAVVLFAIRNAADPARVVAYRHHWLGIGQLSQLRRLARAEGCREMVLIGGVVRPRIRELLLDLEGLRFAWRVVQPFRGGDNHLLSQLLAQLESYGFTIRGAHEIAPQIVVGVGPLGSRRPGAAEQADIARALAVLNANSPFDVGQAAVVAGNRVLAIEGPEGTDQMLARVAAMRRGVRGTGVLVKAPKAGQDRRVDLPSIGPRTIDAAASAGLAGIAVLAGSSIIAEPDRFAREADRANLFAVGVRADGSAE